MRERDKICRYGHETTPENTIYVKRKRKDGSIHMGPRCRPCQLARRRKWYQGHHVEQRKWQREHDRRKDVATARFTAEFMDLFDGVSSFTRPFKVGDAIIWTKIKRRGKPLVVVATNRFKAWASRGWIEPDAGSKDRWRIVR